MPFYHRLGNVPPKRHTVFENPEGGIYYEHLMGNYGFGGLASLQYSIRRPTTVLRTRFLRDVSWEPDPDRTLRMRHLKTHDLPSPGPSPVFDRTPLLFNHDVAISLARPGANEETWYRNAMGDEIVYVTEGGGVLESQFGDLPFRKGDHLVIPRGIFHRYRLDEGETILFVVESTDAVRTPDRYRNPHGQLVESSPYCERDIRPPSSLPVVDATGEFRMIVKKGSAFHEVILDHDPRDIVGWDGYYYPWAFNVEDFEPITGRVHQPPPVHQTFQAGGFVMCAFVPRLFDYHPRAVPAPYHHSNVMSDEVLYYVDGDFMSRKGVVIGSITLHPDGLPHGPQPGKTEASIGKERTDELALMIDTFRPLTVARAALESEDRDYGRSWLE